LSPKRQQTTFAEGFDIITLTKEIITPSDYQWLLSSRRS
jgi:hypothetical protein